MTETSLVSVSAANLITHLQSYDGRQVAIAVRHPTNPDKGFQALAAGPGFHEMIRRQLLRDYGVPPENLIKKPGDRSGKQCVYDARLPELPMEHYAAYVRDLVHATSGAQSLIVWDAMEELVERLTEPYWEGLDPPLIAANAKELTVWPRQIVRQPSEAGGHGGMGHKVRVFRLCTLILADALYDVLLAHPAFATVVPDELASTIGGTRVGRISVEGETFRLANNVGVEGGTDLFQL